MVADARSAEQQHKMSGNSSVLVRAVPAMLMGEEEGKRELECAVDSVQSRRQENVIGKSRGEGDRSLRSLCLFSLGIGR